VPVTYNGFEVQDKFFTVRVADDKPLGIVGNRYTVLQNREALDLMDSMVLAERPRMRVSSASVGAAVWHWSSSSRVWASRSAVWIRWTVTCS